MHAFLVRFAFLVAALAWAAGARAANISIDSNIPNLPFTVDGKNLRTPAVLEWAPGSTHTIAFSAIANGPAGTRYQFLKWMDSGDPYARTITAGTANSAYTAVFTTQYLVTVTASPPRAGTVAGGGWFDAGVIASIEAKPAAAYRFSVFTGDITGAVTPSTISVTRPLNVVAHFMKR
jgi:hypothetical protein